MRNRLSKKKVNLISYKKKVFKTTMAAAATVGTGVGYIVVHHIIVFSNCSKWFGLRFIDFFDFILRCSYPRYLIFISTSPKLPNMTWVVAWKEDISFKGNKIRLRKKGSLQAGDGPNWIQMMRRGWVEKSIAKITASSNHNALVLFTENPSFLFFSVWVQYSNSQEYISVTIYEKSSIQLT